MKTTIILMISFSVSAQTIQYLEKKKEVTRQEINKNLSRESQIHELGEKVASLQREIQLTLHEMGEIK